MTPDRTSTRRVQVSSVLGCLLGAVAYAAVLLDLRWSPGRTAIELRYAWPSELDLMARIAGLRLEHRWGGWRREPFTGLSPSHVSVYLK